MRRLQTTISHDSEVPVSVQCNVRSIIGRLHDLITFVMVKDVDK